MRRERLTEQHKGRISAALKGKRPKNLDAIQASRRGAKLPAIQGERNHLWKGESAQYGSKHSWVARNYGRPRVCEKCGTTTATRYEWHNLSGTYKREREDWQRLCVACHRILTFALLEDYEPWNKGRKIQTNTGRTHIKRGQHLSAPTEFKPGLVPHNKYLEPKQCAQCGKAFQPREAERKFCCQRCYWDSLKSTA